MVSIRQAGTGITQAFLQETGKQGRCLVAWLGRHTDSRRVARVNA